MNKRYQVFVSSTYSDLKEERRAVIQTLMELDCIPAGMELFPAADEEQFKFIQRIIDDCDYYILIIGGRYGSVSPAGISYTEMEYDYAQQKGIQILSFIHEDPQTLQMAETDAELRTRLISFREKVMQGRLAKLWKDASQLPPMVATSLSRTMRVYPAVGWVRANQVATNEALTEINDLRKRNQVLEEEMRQSFPEVENLAGLNDRVDLLGIVTSGHQKRTATLFTTWGELFATVAPSILGQPSDAKMRTAFNESLSNLFNRKGQSGSSAFWRPNDSDYQTVKIQLKALGLVDLEMKPTVNGGLLLFWSLTANGERTLMQLRTAKSTLVSNNGQPQSAAGSEE